MNAKNQQLLWDLYVGIVKDVKKLAAIMETICRYCKECKMPTTIMGFICGY
jgi:hypothetical protein